MQFLSGLNEQYSNVWSHFLHMDPMPTISKIFSYVAQQEWQLLGNNLMTNINLESKGSLINVVNSICNFCGRAGHMESVCYRKHEFLSNYDGKNRGNNTKNGKTCTHWGRNGHTVDVCYRKHEFPLGHKFYNAKTIANSIVTVDSKVTDDQTQHHKSQEVRLSPEQYKALLALIQQPFPGNSASTPSHVNQIASVSSCSTNPTPTSGISLSSINYTHTHTHFLDTRLWSDWSCLLFTNSFPLLQPNQSYFGQTTKRSPCSCYSFRHHISICFHNYVWHPLYTLIHF